MNDVINVFFLINLGFFLGLKIWINIMLVFVFSNVFVIVIWCDIIKFCIGSGSLLIFFVYVSFDGIIVLWFLGICMVFV